MVIAGLGDPGGVEPLGARIKSPLPNRLRLERSGSIGDGDAAASRPGLVLVDMVVSLLVVLVLPHGIEPRSSGYRPGALPLSYGRDAGASSRTRTAGPLHVAQVLSPLS